MAINTTVLQVIVNTTKASTSTITNNTGSDEESKSSILQLTQMQIALYIVMAILGTLGNTLTITVLLKPKYRKRKSSILLLNLAICDTLIAALCIPLDVVYFVHSRWMFGKQMCYVIPPFQTSMPIVSSWTFMFMMLERNSIFVKSIKGQMRKRSIRILAMTTWIVSAALVIPYGTRLVPKETRGKITCDEEWTDKLGRQMYTVILSVTEFLVPMIVIVVFVIRICLNLAKQSNQLKKNALGLNEAKRHSRLRQNRNITKMFIVMIAVYASLKLPNNIFWQFSEFGGSMNPKKKNLIWVFVALAAYSTSMVNPMVLAAMSSELRKEFLNVLKCKSCWNTKSRMLCQAEKTPSDEVHDSSENLATVTHELQTCHAKNAIIEMKSFQCNGELVGQLNNAEERQDMGLLKIDFTIFEDE
eukprot:gene16308-17951_t